MNVIASWLGSKLASFGSASFDALSNIWHFIININNYIFQFFSELGHLITYLIKSTVEFTELIGTFPSFITVFATASITVIVAYKILGRS